MSADRAFLHYGVVFPAPNAASTPAASSEASAPAGGTEDDELFLEAFPGMAYTRPDDPHSIVIGERVRLQLTYQVLARAAQAARRAGMDGAEARRRTLHAFYEEVYDLDPRDYERNLRWFRESAKDARDAFRVILGYVPSSRLQSFEMNAAVEKCTDPVELLRLCGASGRGFLADRARFEARRQLVLAQLAFECRLQGMGPEDLQRRHDRLSSILLERYFVRGRSAGVGLAVIRDPANEYRVQRIRVCAREDVQPGEVFDEVPMRLICFHGRMIPVLYLHRPKSHTVLKLVAKRQRDPRLIADGDGLKLVFLTMEDLQDGVEHLRRTVIRQPGTVFAQKSNLRAAGIVDRTNGHSSHQFRADKFEARRDGFFAEIQFALVGDDLDASGSDGPENHGRYKARKHLESVFPRFFPRELYPSDDPALMESMLRAVAARIRLARSFPAPAGFFLTFVFVGANME